MGLAWNSSSSASGWRGLVLVGDTVPHEDATQNAFRVGLHGLHGHLSRGKAMLVDELRHDQTCGALDLSVQQTMRFVFDQTATSETSCRNSGEELE